MFCQNSFMTDPVDAAFRAQDLDKIARSYRRAKATLAERRADLHQAVISSVTLHGMSKSEAARLSGYTREYVAKICDPDKD